MYVARNQTDEPGEADTLFDDFAGRPVLMRDARDLVVLEEGHEPFAVPPESAIRTLLAIGGEGLVRGVAQVMREKDPSETIIIAVRPDRVHLGVVCLRPLQAGGEA